jgi:hypothetical protein
MTEQDVADNTIATEQVVEVVSKKPIGRPKKQGPASLYLTDKKAYFRDYFHNKVKVQCSCEICGKLFNSIYSKKRHLTNNNKCMIIKLTAQIQELKKEEPPAPPESAPEYSNEHSHE